MAKKKGKNAGYRNDLRQLLHQLGAYGDYSELIDRAVRGSWSSTQFEVALRRSKPFQQQFRGLVTNDGSFTKQFMDQGISNLGQAISQYRRMSDAYTDAARAFGVKVKGGRLEQLFRSEVSPDEFGQRIAILSAVKANPGLLDAYNQSRKLQGLKPLDKQGLFKGIATRASGVYDSYQAAYLQTSGLNFTGQEALDTARAIDSPLKPNMDLGQLVSEVRRVKGDIGPELARLGASDAYLVGLAAGQDPLGLAPKLEQMTNQRRARSGPGTYAQESSSGGMSIYPEDEAGY